MNRKCNNLGYWEPLIKKNRTLKERIFENDPITEKTMYIHYAIFNKKTGIESAWVPVPDLPRLIGFIKFCFLPAAYYEWIVGKERTVGRIPIVEVEEILTIAMKNNKITSTEKEQIKGDMEAINKLWTLGQDEVLRQLKRFCTRFNLHWLGDSTEFLYLKVFKDAKELGEFVVNTNNQTDYEKIFEEKIELTEEKWLTLCNEAHTNREAGEMLKQILFKQLKEII